MMTIKSNIEFLTNKHQWLKSIDYDTEMIENLQYAIETLKIIDQLKDDAWDEKRADIIGQNSNEGLHYEQH